MYKLTIVFLLITINGFAQLQNNLIPIPTIEIQNISKTIYAKNEISLLGISVLKQAQTTATICPGGAGCVLPLTSIILKGKRFTKDIVQLHWVTLNEIDGKSFDLELSFDNAVNFVKVTSVKSNHDAVYEKKYSAIDNNNFEGITYYRIKQIDINGKFTYSNIIAVKGIAVEELLQVYPNPAKNNINAIIVCKKNTVGKISICDAGGKIFLLQNINLIKGFNTIPINTLYFSDGFYIIKIVRPQQTDMILKFVKN
jgi:hypothetical protein